MSYTAAQVIAKAQRLMVDTDDDAYADASLDYFNEAQTRFATETHCCQAIADMTMSAATVAFTDVATAIGTHVKEIGLVPKVQLLDTARREFLRKAPVSEMTGVQESTIIVPTRYSIFADNLFFDLHPDSAFGSNIRIFCSYVPVDCALASPMYIPDKWVQAIVHYIVYCCHLSDRAAGLANGSFNSYETIRQDAAAFYLAQMER